MMNEQQLHERLQRATDLVVGGPDLPAALRTGRARRRRTRGLAALGAAAVLAVGGVGVATALGGDDPSPTAVDAAPAPTQVPAPSSAPSSPGPAAPQDWVPGTDFDQQLAATVATHLPSLGTPDDVYPSDGHTAGPLPDTSWRSAEDWQAAYTVDGRQTIVMTASAAERFTCDGCRSTPVADGTRYEQTYDADGLTWHGTWLLRPDGTSTTVLESVAQGAPAALPAAAVDALLQDPGLRVPSGA